MTYRTLVFSALVALTAFNSLPLRADNVATLAITPATGAVTLVPRWTIGSNLVGLHHMAQDLSLGGGANQFYSIKGTTIPAGGDIAAFTRYIAASGAATNHTDIGSKLTPNSYSALTSADGDVGYGPVNFYFIHHKSTGDYFTTIVPGSATASAVTDLKPMSGPGGPATLGATGYFGLTFAAANLGYGLNQFYYLRTDPASGYTKFGSLQPALLGTSADRFDLGVGGHKALAFTGSDVGFGTDKMYYLRLDPLTGFTIFGTLHPVSGRASDVANLGSVYSTLTFTAGDLGFGSGRFYTAGTINTDWQSISFAAIDDRAMSAGSFTVNPSASSGLALGLSVVAGSTGSATISGPVAGVFTVTPTAPGRITLQAKQDGQTAPVAYATNMLRQSFTVTGTDGRAVVTTQPQGTSSVVGSAVTLTVTASGTPAPTYQWRKDGVAIAGATSSTLTLNNFQVGSAGSYTAALTNSAGTVISEPAVVGVISTAKVTGAATEFAANIVHANGNLYDQVLLSGSAATITADANQATRVSFIDLSDDIVQVEFSGAGTLTLSLENSSGPAVATKYNQPTVSYMRGHASLVITGANETTNVSVFSVGTITAVNQALFKAGTSYDGVADIGSISIVSTNGKFGGVRTANSSYLRAAGFTGLHAPGIQFTGPVYLGDLTASDSATGAILIGSGTDTRITGGDVLQSNAQPVVVSGLSQLRFVDGTTSHNVRQAAQVNRARFEQAGVDVTTQIVVNPTP